MKTLFTFFLICVLELSAFAEYGQTVTVSFAGNGLERAMAIMVMAIELVR